MWIVAIWWSLFVGCGTDKQGVVVSGSTLSTAIPENIHILGDIKVLESKVLDIAAHADPVNYDIHRSFSTALHRTGPGLVYSRLLRFSADSEDTMLGSVLECDLCSKWEQIDQTTYRFTLRDNVRWHNIEPLSGRLITVEDVMYSYQRQQTKGWPNAELLRNLKDIVKVNDSVMEIQTYIPDADFVLSLAAGHSKILPVEVSSSYGDVVSKGPIGTGPWVLLREFGRDEYILEANPFYYEPGLPRMDLLRIMVIPDQMVRFASMAVGDLDFVDLTFEQVQTLEDRPGEFVTTTVPTYGYGIDFVLNTKRIPLTSLEVRQSIFSAIDPWKYSRHYWPGKTFNGLGFPARHESWYMSEKELKEYVGSSQKSIALLSGTLSDVSVTLSVGDYGIGFADLAKEITRDLASFGMVVEIKTISATEYVQMAEGKHGYDMYLGPSVPLITPNQYLFGVLHSEGRYNSSGYSDVGLDLLIELQGQELDPLSRTNIIKEINQRGMYNATRLMLVTDNLHWGWDRRLIGVSNNAWAQEYFNYAYFTWGAHQ